MPLPQLPASPLPTSEPIYYTDWPNSPEGKAQTERNNAANRKRWAEAAARPQSVPQPARMTDAEARALLQQGEAELAQIHGLLHEMQDRVEAQRKTVRADETAIHTAQSVFRSAMEVFVAHPMTPKPDDITAKVSELRVQLSIHEDQLRVMERDLSMMSGTYQTATESARKTIDRAHHHLRLNFADRVADRLESALREAILADAALRGLNDRAILEKDGIAQRYVNRCLEGTRRKTSDELMRYRAALSREADAIREKFHDRSAVSGGHND